MIEVNRLQRLALVTCRYHPIKKTGHWLSRVTYHEVQEFSKKRMHEACLSDFSGLRRHVS
ncbi:hypothetical protein Pan258_57940 [Symmachiella dynata]|nr:hypothetical protein Pan258_57940 [Symmachiella dynata]